MTRIAIVRLTSLGDVVHTLPVAAAIRRNLPDAEVSWIVEEHEQVLVRDNPVVDRVVVASLRKWRRAVARGHAVAATREVARFARAVRLMQVDVILDVQGWAHKTSPIVLLSGARTRVGFARSHSRDPWSPLFTTHHIVPGPAATHVVDQNLALLEPLGIEAAPPCFVFPAWPGAEERVTAWVATNQLAGVRPIVLLPSTRGRRKLWPAGRYAELANRLAAAAHLPVVLAGGPADREIFTAVVAHGATARMYAPDAVGDLARFLAHAALVVGNDTGPLHLAAAARVPTIGLFGPTSGRRNGPYGPNGRFIQSSTGRMDDIAVGDVFEVAIRALT